MANRVFISYAREDQTYARALADHLRQCGFDVWMDERIDFGDRWWQTIVENLLASAAFVVVMTPESHNSEWVEREVLLALKHRKPIFPLLLRGEGFDILINKQHADVTDGHMPADSFCDRLRQVALTQKPTILPREHPFEPEMILIPAGDFLMGSDPVKDKDAYDREQSQHKPYLPDYYIAKTHITNAQYAAFVKATDYELPDHWERGRPPGGREDHPVVNVSWRDAFAYCDWLSELTDRPCRIPSEAEWEKAARSTDGRIYPWGNDWDPDRCNSKEAGIEDTTPVGAYPTGASPYGLLDMAGNVWERTCSLYRDYPYDPKDGREDLYVHARRLLRGGSWASSRRDVRCAYRGVDLRISLDFNVGFRIVFPSSPAS